MHPTRHSLLISFAEKYTLLLLSVGGSMWMARLLTPAELGVYSVGAVLVGLGHAVRDFGVGQYLIQEKDLSMEKLRAALAVSLLVAWLLATAILLGSGTLARFYGEPRLGPVLNILSLNFFLIPFSSMTLPCLRRQLRLSAIFAINASNVLVNLAVALTMAHLGYGYLSLTWAAVAGTAAALLASLYWRPAHLPWLPGWKGIAPVAAFGALSTGGGLIDEAGVAAPDLIVGKMIDIESVAVLSKAMGVLGIFQQAITAAISPVVYPLFAAQSRGGGDPGAAYLTTIAYMTGLAWPFFLFVGLTASPLVHLLYGAQWHGAVPLIRIMCFSTALYSMFSMARYLFVACGHVKAQAQLDAAATLVRVAAIALAAPFGLVWVAWAVVAGVLFRCWATYRCLCRLNGLRAAVLAGAVRKSLILSGITALGPAGVLYVLPWRAQHTLWPLLCSAFAALLCWVGGVLLLKHEIGAEFVLARHKLCGLAPAK